MKSIILILPYFGKWPIWFEAHLVSIAKNPTINWLIVTDCVVPESYPSNIKFVNTTLQDLNKKVNKIVEANVPLTPRKFCDLKPAYGAIFNEYSSNYDFWGFCDMDIIWGDIRKFITKDILENYDIISSRKEAISGHFNLFRNTASLNNLYKQVSNYKELFEESKFKWFDEYVLTNFIKERLIENTFEYKVYWPTILLNQERGIDSRQEYYLNRWMWQNSKMINTKTNEEVMYLHFINWKKLMQNCEVIYNQNVDLFYVSYKNIHIEKYSYFTILLNTFINIFDGYYVRLWQYNRKNNIKKLIKKLKNF
jgi:hypothetical protein